ncbi:hypothetical protein AA0313_1370 [Acetobacter indonesiensis NRIC 0313]|uniref:Uncharacterized protein n=1 Tax=Acetobacter indonesiensis TaxID=104101 RepID=A0A6N3T7R5_9PROT|nr:hypothetical protein [Acetobacter indonesiensis]GAN61960.1 hypothetical protein Abin_004_030 [Acetobacter indonesiensis]GBQ57131.1 hypothetical protein AA0313_1370 [Acetobacter indonesiensis NRIC 0313]GEN04525.1 hypothetical protein AIN02nite_25500 [Acetobacter indonesiensis]
MAWQNILFDRYAAILRYFAKDRQKYRYRMDANQTGDARKPDKLAFYNAGQAA